ncbi:MAG TPA: serine/threonine-protein kinase [Kofleriaceae bacterium]|nr:serine/threonine-protein kinase [Kofleriaceae bacterium]
MVLSSRVPLQEGDLEHYPRKFGKYHLLGPLAQGGMGALYLAVTGDRGLERLMVIKTVLPHLADAEYVARFRDEAKVVVKLSHGNLIPVFDAGLVGGELFLAMDFVEGRDLRAVWNRCAKKQVAFPIDVAVYVAKELCRGLAYAHNFPDLNLVHRDISPPNILVSYTGEVKLTDFGLASSTLKLEKTAPGIIYGKVAYMSPEQARGEKLDGRSDMYAAAIVLWELLTGRQLFPPGKDQPQDLLSRAKNPEVMRPSKRAPRVPVELDEICLKALASDKSDRYADCDEMRMALQTWLAHNAPTTDGTRMSSFLQELFSEDIGRERSERAELMARVRTRALTLPPTDELRQMIERSERATMPPEMYAGNEVTTETPVRRPGSLGRRSSDRGEEIEDRRRQSDRRGLGRAVSPPAIEGGAAALAHSLDASEAEPDLIGAEVDDRYRVLELIGEGGMGKVYLAEHVEIGKRVALKVLHPSYSRMPDLVERFRREARAASKIGHPNIVDVTDSGTTTDGSVYFVMEYLEGVELGSVIEREGAIDIARALRIAGQICRALAAAHAQGIVHRDLKPENIFLVTRDGAADVVKVLDFGIAKTTEAEAARERRLTSPGMAMGTPEYMAPEQAAGRPADSRCDVYALGAIMYEMVTGLPPYSGDNFMEILTKKATIDPTPPVLVRADLPAQVSELVMAAMARNPDARPQTMETLEYELNKCLAGRGVAVAQILGMTTDANVVATLNPGLSMRTLDDGAIVSRSSNASVGSTRGVTHSGQMMAPSDGMFSGPHVATGQNALQVRIGSEPSAAASGRMASQPAAMPAQSLVELPAYEPPSIKRSGLGVFGWLLLAALLFGGVGALLYVALGERGERAPSKLDEAVQPAPQVGVAPEVPPGPPPAPVVPQEPARPAGGDIKVVPDEPPGGEGSAAPGTGTSPVATGDDPDRKADGKKPGARPIRRPGVAAVDERDPKALLRQGKQHEKSGDWEAARAVYQKLEKIKGHAGIALYQQAWVAIQTNELDVALQLASRSAGQPGPYKIDAKFLYGDALYKQGEFRRAKDIYIGLRKGLTGEMKATATRKIAAANRALKLPEDDGIVD